MKKSLFREKSIKKISSPDQLTDYIRVTNPGVWMVLVAIIVLLIGVCAWGFLGKIDTKEIVATVSKNGLAVCYIKESEIDLIKEGMTVTCDGQEFTLGDIPQTPITVREDIDEYARYVGNLQIGEWVYIVPLVGTLEDGIYPGSIITDTVAPKTFAIN